MTEITSIAEARPAARPPLRPAEPTSGAPGAEGTAREGRELLATWISTLRLTADSIGESSLSELTASVDRIDEFLTREIVPSLRAQHAALSRRAHRDYCFGKDPPNHAEIEDLGARLTLVKMRLSGTASRETLNELRHILYSLATLARPCLGRLD